MRDFIFNNIVRQYSHWSTFIDYKVTAAIVDLNAFATSQAQVDAFDINAFKLYIEHQVIPQIKDESLQAQFLEKLTNMIESLDAIKKEDSSRYNQLIPLLIGFQDSKHSLIGTFKALTKIIGYANYLTCDESFIGYFEDNEGHEQPVTSLLNQLFTANTMRQIMEKVTLMYRDYDGKEDILGHKFETNYELYIDQYKTLITKFEFTDIPPRDKILFYWTFHGLSLTFQELNTIDDHHSSELRQIMTNLVLVNAMIDDMVDNFKDLNLVRFLIFSFIDQESGFPANNKANLPNDEALDEKFNELFEPEEKRDIKKAAKEYAITMRSIFYQAITRFPRTL